jgi:hypothetical protein
MTPTGERAIGPAPRLPLSDRLDVYPGPRPGDCPSANESRCSACALRRLAVRLDGITIAGADPIGIGGSYGSNFGFALTRERPRTEPPPGTRNRARDKARGEWRFPSLEASAFELGEPEALSGVGDVEVKYRPDERQPAGLAGNPAHHLRVSNHRGEATDQSQCLPASRRSCDARPPAPPASQAPFHRCRSEAAAECAPAHDSSTRQYRPVGVALLPLP